MERSKLIDTLKGAGIMFVILGHISLTPTALKVWLYSFHMPLFFICSGLVFSLNRYKDYKSFIKAKVNSIVVPYFCLGMVLWLLKNCLNFVKQIYNGNTITDWKLGQTAISLVLGHRLHHYYFSLWFLCVLFFSELVFYFIEKFAQKTTVRRRVIVYILTAILAVMIEWIVLKFIKGWFLSLDLVPAGIAFLSVGRLFRIINDNCKVSFQQKWQLPIALLSSVFTCVLNYRISGLTDLYSCNIGNPLLYFSSAITGSWFIIILLSQLGEMNPVEYLGKNSLIIYAFQNSFCIPAAKLVNSFLKNRFGLLSDRIAQWLVIISITLILSVILVELINHFFPWMLGRKRIISQK